MQEYVVIDFETANPKRVSACALGYAKVSGCEIVESDGYLINPVGGHAPFQSKIHGIKEEHTRNQPDFGELYPQIQDLFNYPLVAHSLFDNQVLNALCGHFGLDLCFEYTDSCSIAKERLPHLTNFKLKTLAKHFGLPAFKHHDAVEDAIACAKIFIALQQQGQKEVQETTWDDLAEFKGMVLGILADDVVNYKEAYQLLYWLQDHIEVASHYLYLSKKIVEVLDDDHLDKFEAQELKAVLEKILTEPV